MVINYMRENSSLQAISARRFFLRPSYVAPFLVFAFSNHRSSTCVDGIDVQIGRRPHARTVRISQAALSTVPTLQRQLCDGAGIVNADPDVFEIVLQYIEWNWFLAYIRLGKRNPLIQMIGGADPMLTLAKAWHIGHMLDLLEMQNELIEMFSNIYRRLLTNREQMRPDPAPFSYVRNHVGNFTRCEKFLIDFYAGLATYRGPFGFEELECLPEEIASALCLRRSSILMNQSGKDRILQGRLGYFKVSSFDCTRYSGLQVARPSAAPKLSSAAIPYAGRILYESPTTWIPRVPGSEATNERQGYRSRPSPLVNVGQHYEVGTRPSATQTQASGSHVRPSYTSVMAPEQALQRKASSMAAEKGSLADEVVTELSSSPLCERSDSHQNNETGVRGNFESESNVD